MQRQVRASVGFTGFVAHSCRNGSIRATVASDITERMKERVDEIAVTDRQPDLADGKRQVLCRPGELSPLRAHPRLSTEPCASNDLGGDVNGQIEVPPLALVNGTTMNFFQFHYSYREGETLHRIIGWTHPTLLQLLKYRQTALFNDGTFRCVPRPSHQCVVVIVHDRATGCNVPVFYTIATERSHTTYSTSSSLRRTTAWTPKPSLVTSKPH
jgi:hypothetical protein